MPANSFSTWQHLPPYQIGQGGNPSAGASRGLGITPEPGFRSHLDATRAMYRQVPGAQYPDGYLGTIRSRRDDRLMRDLQDRQNKRSYQRGVHVGTRVEPTSYLWSPEFNPQSGIVAQMEGRRQRPLQEFMPNLTNDGKPMPRGSQSLQPAVVDPERVRGLQRFKPRWQ